MNTICTLEGLTSARLSEKRMTREELCRRLGIRATSTLRSKVRGETKLTIDEAKRLAKFLDVSIEDICSLLGYE